jgi:hypothetical protein
VADTGEPANLALNSFSSKPALRTKSALERNSLQMQGLCCNISPAYAVQRMLQSHWQADRVFHLTGGDNV